MKMIDLTNVDADSGYHNWLEAQRITHTPEREQAFKEGWRILSDFIAGPEQKAVDWSVVCEAVADAADIDGIGPKALESSFGHSGLLVVHRKEMTEIIRCPRCGGRHGTTSDCSGPKRPSQPLNHTPYG